VRDRRLHWIAHGICKQAALHLFRGPGNLVDWQPFRSILVLALTKATITNATQARF
jgi:hypothetical protein